MSVDLLAYRYGSIGKAAIRLNAVQRAARDAVLRKIEQNIYRYTNASCPVCGSNLGMIISRKDTYGLPFEVSICQQCEFVYANKYLDSESLHRFYNEEYRPLDRGRMFPAEEFYNLQYQKGLAIHRELLEAGVSIAPNTHILEVGCGAGGILGYFRDAGYPILGFDIGAEYLEFGRNTHGLDLREGDLSAVKLAVQNDSIQLGLVIYEQVLEHLPDPVAELRAVRTLLSEDSFLFVGVPGVLNIKHHYGADFLRYLQFPHLCNFDLSTLTKVCSLAGFSLVAGNEVVHAIFRSVNHSQHNDIGPAVSVNGERLRYFRALETDRRHRLPKRLLEELFQTSRELLRFMGLGRLKRRIVGALRFASEKK